MSKFIVFKKKIVGKNYPDDLLLMQRFWSVHTMDTLLYHEATGGIYDWQWSGVNDTTKSTMLLLSCDLPMSEIHSYRTYFFNGCKVNLNTNLLKHFRHTASLDLPNMAPMVSLSRACLLSALPSVLLFPPTKDNTWYTNIWIGYRGHAQLSSD